MKKGWADAMNELPNLVLKAKDADASLAKRQEAFCGLVSLFQDMAYACAYARLGDFYLAEEAAQEAFISDWQKLNQLRKPEAFPGWFRRIVLTECSRLTRGKHLRTTLLDDGVKVRFAHADQQTVIERDEFTTAAFKAIRKLPPTQRMTVLLFYVKEYSQKDISAFLGVPLTTVAKRLYSARVHLRGMTIDPFRTDLNAHRPSRNQTFAEKVRAGVYDEYIGQYQFELRPDLVVTISKEGDRLMSEAREQRNELFASDKSESELLTKEFNGSGKFIRNKRGRITHLIYYEFGCERGLAKKLC
jgi:RNA polymerase sigma factor (sigma-70 family)